LALLSVGVVNLLSSTSYALIVLDEWSSSWANAFLGATIIDKGSRTRMARFTGSIPESALSTSYALGTIIIGEIGWTSALMGSGVEYKIIWTTQTLFCNCTVECISRASKTLTIREKRSIGRATFALLSVGVIDLLSCTSDALIVLDVRSSRWTNTFFASYVIDKGGWT
jgi:hypothetical protein